MAEIPPIRKPAASVGEFSHTRNMPGNLISGLTGAPAVLIATQITKKKWKKGGKDNCFAALARARGRWGEQAVSADGDVIGIDPGTTQSLVGVADAGFPILLEDGWESWMTRSVVYYAKDGMVVGEEEAG